MAYSYTARTLAVAIGSHVYIWTEEGGDQNPPLMPFRLQNYVTSVSFSSTNGGHAILAVARQNGQERDEPRPRAGLLRTREFRSLSAKIYLSEMILEMYTITRLNGQMPLREGWTRTGTKL